ncbi:hypothetical protein JCM17960_22220 [Magnetospira thiophila]
MESYCLTQVRDHDPDRCFCAMFVPAERRRALLAVLAFNVEIASIRERVREPMLGRIRLQWWRESLDALERGQIGDHELLRELGALRERGLWPLSELMALIEARERDMEPGPLADLAALEAYAAATSAPLARASLDVLSITDPVSRQAVESLALAWALLGLVRALPFHRAQGRRLLPLPDPPAGDGAVVVGVLVRARMHLARARRQRVVSPAKPLLLPSVLARGYIRDLESVGFDPDHPALHRPGRGRRRGSLLLHGLLGRY